MKPSVAQYCDNDTAANGIGMLTRETNPGFTRTYTYDAKSRPASTTTTIDGVSYTSSQTYDAASRVNVISYPTGFAVRNVYRPAGYLEQVQHVNNGQVYWTANTVDVEGHITQETLGNNRVTYRDYASDSGRLIGIKTASTGAVQDLQYQFDKLGNLESRADLAQGYRENFNYDPLNRLTAVTTVTGSSTLTRRVTYDDLGNIETKSGATGTYLYASPRPHAMTGADGDTFAYDANGNMLSGANRTLTWNVANLPTKINQGTVARYFSYGPDRARYKQSLTGSGSTETTHYVGGLYEQMSKGTVTSRRHHIYAQGQVIAVYTTQNNTQSTLQYLHRDHLGSIDTITNDIGQVIERLSYDAWGKRRASDWTQPAGQLTSSFDRGFTGHEHLDDVGLIHMNGRVYHPGLGRFISADPTVQFPKASQSFNRYSYVINNPLSYTDPSGFGFFSEILQFQHTIDPLARKFDDILAKSSTLQSIGGVAAGVASVYFGPWVAAAYSAHLTNIQGGSTGDILKAGAIAGGAAAASGAAGGLNPYAAVAANIAIGTAAGVASGADFEDSFYASAITSVASAGTASIDNPVLGATVAAAIGGTASELPGGKFVNGAVTGAFQDALIRGIAAARKQSASSTSQTEAQADFASHEEANFVAVAEQETWALRGTVEGYGTSGSFVTGPGEVRVIAFDTAASPHVRTFAYEFTVTPAEHNGMYLSPVYEAIGITGAYGAVGTETIYPGSGIQQSRWTFKITNTAPSGCDNCGQPGLKIYERWLP
ncbi:MAG: RHS repeat-associated core domain-containing protein [Gammaproteobacteria bacterium]|nr:RHS repeat-associated core domain-containing protein [Gammaproteobacteria bacterium]